MANGKNMFGLIARKESLLTFAHLMMLVLAVA
jgi:hypothetical protein